MARYARKAVPLAPLNTRIPAPLLDRVREAAKTEGRPLQETVAWLLTAGLEVTAQAVPEPPIRSGE